MHPLLSELGVSAELQDWFGTDELSFDYGDEQEVYGADFHRVPVTADLWLAGNYPATELIVTSSAMEAIAYMALNRHRHPPDAVLSFIAVGNLPHPRQLKWISSYCLKRKITLVFPDDMAGRVADIVVAAGIRGKAVRAEWVNGCLRLLMNRPFMNSHRIKSALMLLKRQPVSGPLSERVNHYILIHF